ncbi:MAG: ribonuclease H-like domain-containing protein [Lachnospiraceae bacterium]|nr:ribonuclease H-like domain-containing protein [Lachnospiraceae bacterium]
MKTVKTPIKPNLTTYPYEKLGDLQDILFMDIETTGFSPDSSVLYLIGCAYIEDGIFNVIQWMAENYDEEEAVLYAFYNFASSYKKLVHFNGNHFDIPFMSSRIEELDLPFDLRIFEGIDIYKRLKPYKEFLKLQSLKQRSIEEYMGLEREDTLGGMELVNATNEYLQTGDEDIASTLLLHNLDDLKGLVGIVPMLAVTDLFTENIRVTKAGRNPYTDADGIARSEVIMELALPSPLPVPVSYGWSDCYFTGEGTRGKLRVSVYQGELKYFYPNYKEYYYLPDEDVAVHKSVAAYVDPSKRENAKASNCYTKKCGIFLPQWDPLFSPVFRQAYKEPTMYFELTDEFKHDPKRFATYAKHLLQMLVTPY